MIDFEKLLEPTEKIRACMGDHYTPYVRDRCFLFRSHEDLVKCNYEPNRFGIWHDEADYAAIGEILKNC